MPRHALLLQASANAVYGEQVPTLAAAELSVVATHLDVAPRDIGTERIGGVEYLVFDTDDPLSDADRFAVSHLSTCHALFTTDGVPATSLAPLDVDRWEQFPSDLITTQRYRGKTNETFTHLLVNCAASLSSAVVERSAEGLPVRLLDPVAGRGTTLNRGLVYGFDVAGIEHNGPDFDEYRTFLLTYLKNGRHKFTQGKAAPKRGPARGTKRFEVTIAGRQRVEFVRGDTADATGHFGTKRFDLLVADLPYGVQHRAGKDGRATGALELVEAAAGSWRAALRGGAGVALAWNARTTDRVDLTRVLSAAGFDVVETDRPFLHRVDRAIERDVLLATT